MQKTINELLRFGIKIARKSGKILLKHYGKRLKIELKSINNLVTEADKKSEAYLVKKIRNRYPDHEILAEESGIMPASKIPEERIRWIIDPLDGTTNFAHGFPFFSISIGIEKDNEIIGGIVYAPYFDELFHAGKYMGAYLNNKKIEVSATEKLADSLVATGFPGENREMNMPHFKHILHASQAMRRCGSAAIDLCYTACGRLDGFWELGLKPWDIAAGSLMIKEAGGRVTNLDGSPLELEGQNILATNGKIHKEMIETL